MKVAERIKQLIEQRNWSVYRLGKESGLSQSTLAHIFRKDSEPTVSTLETICDALGITLSNFFCRGRFCLTDQGATGSAGQVGYADHNEELLYEIHFATIAN